MKATELRIGNYVSVTTTPNEFDVVEEIGYKKGLAHYLAIKKLYYKVWFKHQGIDLIKPIPLTEKWLTDFGFEKDESKIDPIEKPNGNWWAQYEKENVIIYLPCFEYSNDELNIEIKHVHSLQNLYFALTGQELTLNEKEQ
jgi:hypothetical protein